MKLIFASNNSHKAEELKSFVGNRFQILSLREAGINITLEEPFDTLEENATAKSMAIYTQTGENCFSEDTGLEVEALHGEPGVKSARYAGANASFKENIEKLLNQLGNHPNRKARFRTVISLILDGKEFQFEGICDGKIIYEARGTQGFGYDPVFIPEGSDKTFAEMTILEKNNFNHRAKAAARLVAFLQTQPSNQSI
jgi:XTP/dITP diphosphohydrolase